MKNKFTRNGLAIFLVGVLTTAAGMAAAGQSLTYQVNINDTYKFAVGAMPAVRSSSDTVQFIGCYNNVYTGGVSASCFATNSAGVSRNCYTNNADMIAAIQSISSESYIYFQWNTDGTCSYVFVENSSRFKP
jgi:hypothetical protein